MNRILLIDDDPVIRLFYRQELTEEGYEVSAFKNNVDPVICQKQRPDLVIMDQSLKYGKGSDLFKMLRQTDRELPIIFRLDRGPSGFLGTLSPFEDYFIPSSGLDELKQKIKRLLVRKEASSDDRRLEESGSFKTMGLYLTKQMQIDFCFPLS